MTTLFPLNQTPTRRMLTRGMALLTAAVLAIGAAGPGVVAAPSQQGPAVAATQQNVDWMSSETASYLGSIGMDVMVPSWVPSPFTGVAPDVYAGDGSYSLYWMAPGSPPTFLHITGLVGGAFPDGSKADLNVPLSINESVQGWPAIRDIGIPAGSSTPIYDQVWWIVDGVRFSVESNNIGTDSLTIANSMLYLDMPVYVEPTAPPVYEEPVWVEPTSEPVWEEPVYEEPAYEEPTSEPVWEEPVYDEPTADTSTTTTTTTAPEEPVSQGQGGATESTQPTASQTDQEAAGPWSPGRMDGNVPSDGTSGPRPPVIGGDGTGGIFDTSLPRFMAP